MQGLETRSSEIPRRPCKRVTILSGTSEADLLRNYPALSAEDLANAWAYLRAHPAGAAVSDALVLGRSLARKTRLAP